MNCFVLVKIYNVPQPRRLRPFPPEPDLQHRPEIFNLMLPFAISPLSSPPHSPRQLFPPIQNLNFRIIGVFSSEHGAYIQLNRINQQFINMHRIFGPFRIDSIFDIHINEPKQREY